MSRADEGLIDYFGSFITDRRKAKIDQVLDLRTRFLTVVLEDIYQSHNASAVVRSCECFGVQDVYAVERRNRFDVNEDIALGAGQWLDLKRCQLEEEQTLPSFYGQLRESGYRLVAATPTEGALELNDLSVSSRLAIIMGTEEEGLSQESLKLADERVRIPMFGFTESFNVSVSAALIVRELTRRIRQSSVPWQLSSEEKLQLKLKWYRQDLRGSEQLERRYWQERGGTVSG